MKALNPKTGLFETIYVKAIDGLPIGTILEYPTTDSTKLPDGYLYCDGSAVSRTTYSELFNIIGTSWGAGDGSTTFNLPNKAGLVTIGIKSSDSDFNTIGKTGGSKTHTHEYGLAYAGAYRDTVIENDDQAGILNYNSDGTFSMNNGKSAAYGQYDIQVNGGFTASTQTATALTHYMATGNASYASTVQPYNVSNYIIKAKSIVPVAATVSNISSNATNKVYSCNYVNNKFNSYLPLTGGILTGATNTTVCFGIPKNGGAGYGICNSDGISILRDHGNNNVTLDATGGVLYLGYQNTSKINFLNSKVLMEADGRLLASHNSCGSWISMSHGDAAMLYNPVINSAPSGNNASGLWGIKTTNGAWTCGVLSGHDNLYFIYGTDANYNSGINNVAQAYITSAGSFTSGSKRSMKENIKDYNESALKIINDTNICSFNYKGDNAKELKVGFIADDTNEIIAGENHDRMDLNNCIGILMKAMQELSQEVKELKGGRE